MWLLLISEANMKPSWRKIFIRIQDKIEIVEFTKTLKKLKVLKWFCRFKVLIVHRKCYQNLINKWGRKQICMCDEFWIDFWLILEQFRNPKWSKMESQIHSRSISKWLRSTTERQKEKYAKTGGRNVRSDPGPPPGPPRDPPGTPRDPPGTPPGPPGTPGTPRDAPGPSGTPRTPGSTSECGAHRGHPIPPSFIIIHYDT